MRLAAAVAAAAILTAAVGGQSPGRATAFVPGRLWDGKTPDFRGIWQVRDTAHVNIEGHPAERGIAASKSIITSATSLVSPLWGLRSMRSPAASSMRLTWSSRRIHARERSFQPRASRVSCVRLASRALKSL